MCAWSSSTFDGPLYFNFLIKFLKIKKEKKKLFVETYVDVRLHGTDPRYTQHWVTCIRLLALNSFKDGCGKTNRSKINGLNACNIDHAAAFSTKFCRPIF